MNVKGRKTQIARKQSEREKNELEVWEQEESSDRIK